MKALREKATELCILLVNVLSITNIYKDFIWTKMSDFGLENFRVQFHKLPVNISNCSRRKPSFLRTVSRYLQIVFILISNTSSSNFTSAENRFMDDRSKKLLYGKVK